MNKPDFPSFWEGLSLRHLEHYKQGFNSPFPFLLGRAFIEAQSNEAQQELGFYISLPFGKGFH